MKKEVVVPTKVDIVPKVSSSKVTLKTKGAGGRMAGLKVRKVRSKLMLSVPSSSDGTER